ncbi:hypothetical protein FOVG_17173 [Fusarium oxysporum f. sp. pisi HDV247]|uniref:Uncharacterized protein n=1 Tax=Fusarium oxysporum f. sp. pisi HDV247 TaxID=1080344 RepID=W9NNH7_FUSOX|nr:hypothetical protein FOVG_17173 [Fusarium oxysporum f. sp. pisi HDV247]
MSQVACSITLRLGYTATATGGGLCRAWECDEKPPSRRISAPASHLHCGTMRKEDMVRSRNDVCIKGGLGGRAWYTGRHRRLRLVR